MTVDDAWHTFMLRKTLLTHWSVCFEFFGGMTFRDSIIRDTVASLFYIDLLSILNEALQLRMSKDEFQRGRKMKNRLEMLAKKGDLLDEDALLAVNRRRNEIGHEFEKGATVEELDKAIRKVKEQLLAWEMVNEIGDYELEATRTRARSSEDETSAYAFDTIIQVKVGGTVYLEMKQTSEVRQS